jgi:hypothetical protein
VSPKGERATFLFTATAPLTGPPDHDAIEWNRIMI